MPSYLLIVDVIRPHKRMEGYLESIVNNHEYNDEYDDLREGIKEFAEDHAGVRISPTCYVFVDEVPLDHVYAYISVMLHQVEGPHRLAVAQILDHTIQANEEVINTPLLDHDLASETFGTFYGHLRP